MESILSKYGWTINNNIVSNSLGKETFSIVFKGAKYTFLDKANNKLMSGKGCIEKSIEKLLTQFYFCQPKNK